MTIKDCIDIVDNLKPNQYSVKEKVMWLSFIEKIIINEVLKTHEGYDGRYDLFEEYSEDKLSVKLIVPSPYDRLYTAYLKMKIDEENGEIARYNNSAVLFNTYMQEYRKHYNKIHMPINILGKKFADKVKKATAGLTDAEFENLKKELTYILTEYFSSTISEDKVYDVVMKYMQNNAEMFKGKDGKDGKNGKDGYTPIKGVDYKDGEKGVQGSQGIQGPKGDKGYTPQKGVDYFTPEDIESLNIPYVEVKSLQYYGDANIVPSDSSLFEFTLSPLGDGGAAISGRRSAMPSELVIPFVGNVNGESLPITFLWDMCFTGADITSLVLPNTVVEIGVSTFEGCIALTTITIPESVERIVNNAFYGCTALTDVYYRGTKAQWDAITITEGNDALVNATIHYEWSDVTKEYVDGKIGDIDAALEKLHNYAEALVSGGEA